MSKYNITLTWQDDRWEPDPRAPNGIHTCAGWIARWERGKEYGVIWRPTRAAAYSAARRECMKPIQWRLDVVVSGPDMETVGNMIDSLAPLCL